MITSIIVNKVGIYHHGLPTLKPEEPILLNPDSKYFNRSRYIQYQSYGARLINPFCGI